MQMHKIKCPQLHVSLHFPLSVSHYIVQRSFYINKVHKLVIARHAICLNVNIKQKNMNRYLREEKKIIKMRQQLANAHFSASEETKI